MVTNRIIGEMEKGIIPWQKPWTGARNGAYSRATGKPYSIINQFLLNPGEYATFKQISEAGGKVKKGEKSSIVIFWKALPITEKDENNKETEKIIPLLKYYNVFNVAEQCENIDLKWGKEERESIQTIAEAEQLVKEYVTREKIDLQHQLGDKAFYSPAFDRIVMPKLEQFQNKEEYYSTIYHEITHSTGHKDRLNRLNKMAAFGNEEYSKEELVAEIGSATLINMMGLENEKSFKNSVAYLQSWIRVLKNDSKLIVSAAGQAQKAIDFVIG